MGDWIPSCAICGVIFRPEDCRISPAPPASPGTRGDGSPTEPEATPPTNPPDTKYMYDRNLISNSDLLWLSENNALGLWPDSSETRKSFFTGEFVTGYYSRAFLTFKGLPEHIQEIEEELHTYEALVGGQSVFPFHKDCYNHLLARCITRHTKRPIDEEVLYATFVGLRGGMWSLDIEYGDPMPRECNQWLSHRGGELLVMNPTDTVDISMYLRSGNMIPSESGRNKSMKVIDDPFGKLPDEIRQSIFLQLSARDISTLKIASYPMYSAAPSSVVWKRLFSKEMPWVWELEGIPPVDLRAFDLVQTFRELDKQCRYDDDSGEYSPRLANRKRVWGVCEYLTERYVEILARVGSVREWVATDDGCFEMQ
ncbi:hypothetical protein ACJZ2D_013106 [Fusarium nematophilum]